MYSNHHIVFLQELVDILCQNDQVTTDVDTDIDDDDDDIAVMANYADAIFEEDSSDDDQDA